MLSSNLADHSVVSLCKYEIMIPILAHFILVRVYDKAEGDLKKRVSR